MSQRTSEANKAIVEAWKTECIYVSEGCGSRDWTPQQQQDILEFGKAYDDDGKAFEGHHMKSVAQFPEYQGNPYNIQFLSRAEHLEAHHGSFQNPTNGRFDPLSHNTKEFLPGEELLAPICNKLTAPLRPITPRLESGKQNGNSSPVAKVPKVYVHSVSLPLTVLSAFITVRSCYKHLKNENSTDYAKVLRSVLSTLKQVSQGAFEWALDHREQIVLIIRTIVFSLIKRASPPVSTSQPHNPTGVSSGKGVPHAPHNVKSHMRYYKNGKTIRVQSYRTGPKQQ